MKKIVVKKTFEISNAEWKEIVEGFNEEFKKEKTAEELIRFYTSNYKGFSYHGISFAEDGKLSGFTSINPTQYTDAKGKHFSAGLSGSTFVKKEYRNDIFVFHDIYKVLREACALEDCKVILGVPNKNSYKYIIKLLGFKFLFNLPYYVLPVNVKQLVNNKLIKTFNGFIRLLIRLYVNIMLAVSFIYNPREKKSSFDIFFNNETYKLRFNQSYSTIEKSSYRFTYRIFTEKNIRTAYLFDFRQKGERTLRALSKAINHILSNDQVDIIVFVGKLAMAQPLLLHLPVNKEPQTLPLTIDVLADKTDNNFAEYFNASAWNFGLMNFDVR